MDEIQRLEDAGETMKIMYDTFKGRVKIFASGSSSLEIRSKVLGFLVGRAVLFDLYTFGFGEFCQGKRRKPVWHIQGEERGLLDFMENGAPIPAPSFS